MNDPQMCQEITEISLSDPATLVSTTGFPLSNNENIDPFELIYQPQTPLFKPQQPPREFLDLVELTPTEMDENREMELSLNPSNELLQKEDAMYQEDAESFELLSKRLQTSRRCNSWLVVNSKSPAPSILRRKNIDFESVLSSCRSTNDGVPDTNHSIFQFMRNSILNQKSQIP